MCAVTNYHVGMTPGEFWSTYDDAMEQALELGYQHEMFVAMPVITAGNQVASVTIKRLGGRDDEWRDYTVSHEAFVYSSGWTGAFLADLQARRFGAPLA
jgi:hypothetical protein